MEARSKPTSRKTSAAAWMMAWRFDSVLVFMALHGWY
jgi:hypothetical protein